MKIGGGKLSQNPEHFASWQQGHPVGPLTIEVGATYGCNHDCFHCGFQQYNPYGKKRNFLDKDAFLRFLVDFRALGGQEVYFAGNGEPLLNPHMAEWVKAGNELGIDMAMSSNGIPLTPKNATQILPHMAWIRFSVNGGTVEDYVRVHKCKEKDFDILWKNLKFSARLKKEQNLKVNLALQFIVYDLDWDSIEPMVERHLDAGTDLLIFRNVGKTDGSLSVIPDEVRERLKKAEGYDRVQVRWDTFAPPKQSLNWTQCQAIHFKTNMDDRGNLVTCNRNLIKDSVYGNIHEQSFKEIWLESVKKKEVFQTVCSGADIPNCRQWCQVSYDNDTIEKALSQLV
ncbi:radical SAM protein [Acanthopleuribacter pedis]|uniref:Radical SAM protein n=1 Tax=Acanthopleuribacter pedis TaxID=442870 RepID=A0A8J7Q752_9BACT|nr:radical SAM protein [Acanthopleuribacter pedis]